MSIREGAVRRLGEAARNAALPDRTPHTLEKIDMSKKNSLGRSIWQELVTTDTKTAIAFYGELFGWKTRAMEMGPGGSYTLFQVGDKDIAGAIPADKAKGLPPHWNVYFSTPDADKTIKDVKSAGGSVMAPAADIPNVGRFAVLVDPQGTSFSVLASTEERAETDGKVPTGEFCWVEALVDDVDAALAFYKKVFAWSTKPMDMGSHGTYHQLVRTCEHGEKVSGGLMKKVMAGPNAWLSYVAVDDVEATVQRATRLRGKILAPTTQIPNIGTFAVIQDPTGAVLAAFKGA